MKTYSLLRDDGSLAGFEVSSMWTSFGPLYRILGSIEGVTDVRRHYFSDERISFLHRGQPFVVHEPWGDNSRYWIGPRDASALEFAPILQAFQRYQSPAARIWSRVARAVGAG